MDLSEYGPRTPGTDPLYTAIEEAVLHAYRGERAPAQRRIEVALEGFVRLGDVRGEAQARAKAAIVFRHIGDHGRAEREARQALAMLDRAPDRYFRCTALLELQQLLAAGDDPAAAVELFEREEHHLLAGPPLDEREHRQLLLLRGNAATAYMLAARGSPDPAEAARLTARELTLRREVATGCEHIEMPRDAIVEWTNLATTLTSRRELREAGEALDAAQRLLPRLRDDNLHGRHCLARLRLNRARLAEANRDDAAGLLAESRELMARAIGHLEAYRLDRLAVDARLLMAEIELDHGSKDEAQLLLRAAARRLPANQAPTSSVEAWLRNRLDQLRTRLLEATVDRGWLEQILPGGLAGRPGVRTVVTATPEVPAAEIDRGVVLRPELGGLLPFVWARIDAQRALLEVERRRSADLLAMMRHHHAAGDQELLAALTADAATGHEVAAHPARAGHLREVFVDFFVGEEESLAFVEHPDQRPSCTRLRVGATEIAAVVEAMRRDFDGSPTRLGIIRDRPERVSLAAVEALGRRLLPFADELRDADVVCVFPHGPLHNFPFQAVRLADGRVLVEHCAVVFGLSRRLLAVARAARGTRPGNIRRPASALVVAVPAVTERDTTAFHGDGAFLAGLGLGVTELSTPAETTVDRVLEAMAQVDLIHFNCHGVFSAELPLEAALMMSDGHEGPRSPGDLLDVRGPKRLSARRLLPRRLRADTAVLRACSSGLTNVRVGDEIEGLLRALTHAGVGSALVSRWKIDVISSRDLVRAMYVAWLGGDGASKAVALQRAQLSFLRHPDYPYYRHPYHWAPFTLVGDWW